MAGNIIQYQRVLSLYIESTAIFYALLIGTVDLISRLIAESDRVEGLYQGYQGA